MKSAGDKKDFDHGGKTFLVQNNESETGDFWPPDKKLSRFHELAVE